jgi:hypothetical protein
VQATNNQGFDPSTVDIGLEVSVSSPCAVHRINQRCFLGHYP